ncbi:testis-expressed protein 36 isoform 1-T1 [Spinachia spinachia]
MCVCMCACALLAELLSNSIKMVKGGKRYSSMSNDGKWFAHQVPAENETWSRELSTSTGFMLTQVQSSLPQALDIVRYPKWNTLQKSREHPFSEHDNKQALKDNISVFAHVSTDVKRLSPPSARRPESHRYSSTAIHPRVGTPQGVGRRKFLLHRHRQRNPHFLWHDGADGGPEATGRNVTVHQTDFTVKQAADAPTGNRRFPRDHKLKSAEAALSQGGETFLWFGRLDSKHSETLQGQAATDCSAPSEPSNSDVLDTY